jgi:protein-disulfide isomerase
MSSRIRAHATAVAIETRMFDGGARSVGDGDRCYASQRVRRSLLPLVVVAFVCACDRRTDEDLRTMMATVATDHVRPLEERLAALETSSKAKDTEIAALRERVVGLERALAATNVRIDDLARPAAIAVDATPPLVTGPAPKLYKMALGDAHTRGPATALVTIVVWSDFQCPHCAKVDPTFDRIELEYGADVRFAFKHCPLSGHPRAKPAAIAAEAAALQGKFWEMHDELFADTKGLTDETFTAAAKKLGLDMGRFERDLADAAIERRVTTQREECTGFDVQGVPAFFINGRAHEGESSFESMRPVIDERMREAKALVASGTPRDAVYDAVIAAGKTP